MYQVLERVCVCWRNYHSALRRNVQSIDSDTLNYQTSSLETTMTKNDWLAIARTVFTSRLMDTIEETELVPAGRITYQFSAKGHELGEAVLAHTLQHILPNAHDGAGVYYRSRPFLLNAGLSIRAAFAGPLGKATGRSGGRDIGVVHNLPPQERESPQPALIAAFNNPPVPPLTRGAKARSGFGGIPTKECSSITVLPSSGDVGAQFTPALGWAQAAVYRNEVMRESAWEGACGIALSGDGAVATNGFWAALVAATTLNLPMLFLVEDNGFGISVPSLLQTPEGNIAANLKNFAKLHIVDGSGTSPEETARLIREAVSHVRTRVSPVLLRLTVPRLCGHSGADNQSYKTAEQRADEERRDPVPILREFLLKKKLLTKATLADFERDIETEVRAELALALADAEPHPDDAATHTFFTPAKPQLVGGMLAEGVVLPYPAKTVETEPRLNLIEAVKRVIDEELALNPRVVVFGEDVGVKGGVHGATVDLQRKYGIQRVFDTSLSEEGIIGRAVGMALAGLVPVPEIQFRKYADPATEQLNDCGTIRWRTNGDFAAPMVVRIPVGYGKRTGDPWHSVSGEAVFAHSIGWRIAFPSNARDAAGLMRSALRGNDPTYFLEHRALLDTAQGRALYPVSAEITVPFGVAARVREGARASIITWGEMLYRAIEAAERCGGNVEVLDLRTIIPWDKEAIFASVRKTGRALILHEDTHTAGFGGEIAAWIAQECFTSLDAPVERLATKDCPIPYHATLMNAVVPSVTDIAQRLQKLLDF
jgi:2-oxoisovalerate dehydrogenase E1 component